MASWILPLLLLLVASGLVVSQVQRIGPLIRVGLPWVEILMLAAAMTPIVIMGGIDLSVGGTIALCVVTMGLTHDAGLPIGVCVSATVLVALCCGALNGLLIVFGIAPLVVTLATMALYQGLALTLLKGDRITGFPGSFLQWSEVGPFPIQYWLAAIVVMGFFYVLHLTRWGHWMYAIGDRPMAARYAAIPTRHITFTAYMASGLVAGLIAVFYTMTHDAAIANPHRNVELRVIASIIVGGTLITGGVGGIDRTIIGWAIVGLLDIGMEFLGNQFQSITAQTRLVFTGVLLISLAVWNQKIRQFNG